MKAIIPVAGKGTRLRPHTHTVPKALITVAGKPILGHILDELKSLGVTEVILILGYLGSKIKEYVEEEYPDLHFVYAQQEHRLGLGHAISMAKPFVKEDEPVLIIYGDTIFVGDISKAFTAKKDGSIGCKIVDDPRRFGVVEKQGDKIIKLVEKPNFVKPMPAIVGVNYIVNSSLMFACLQELIEKDIRTKDEYQITDAFELMVQKGAYLETFEMEGWFDCGKPETLLATNRYLLNKLYPTTTFEGKNSIILPPVYIGKNVSIISSIIGPNVAISDDVTITGSIIQDSIINEGSSVEAANLRESIIGTNAVVVDSTNKLNVGDNSLIES